MIAALPDAALELWQASIASPLDAPVFPDGCRDLIVNLPARGAPACFVSALADRVETVRLVAGDRLVGVRMRPGAQFDEPALLAALAGRERFGAADLLAAVGDVAGIDARVREALDCLAGSPSLAAARAVLGVSERSLERLLTPRTGRRPAYWRSLARARRCARALGGGAPLIEIALDHGYADHAHMARDLRRWFGATPARMRADPVRFASLVASGHG